MKDRRGAKKALSILCACFLGIFLRAHMEWYSYTTALYMCLGIVVTGAVVELIFPPGYGDRREY